MLSVSKRFYAHLQLVGRAIADCRYFFYNLHKNGYSIHEAQLTTYICRFYMFLMVQKYNLFTAYLFYFLSFVPFPSPSLPSSHLHTVNLVPLQVRSGGLQQPPVPALVVSDVCLHLVLHFSISNQHAFDSRYLEEVGKLSVS